MAGRPKRRKRNAALRERAVENRAAGSLEFDGAVCVAHAEGFGDAYIAPVACGSAEAHSDSEAHAVPEPDAFAGTGNAIFATADDLRRAVNGYFDDCDANRRLYGEAGLCLWLSAHNTGMRAVTLDTLRRWYDGERCPYLQDTVQYAYLRIQAQIESDPRYREKGGMSSRAIFLQKQPRLGGYQDKAEEKKDITVRLVHDPSIVMSDFE